MLSESEESDPLFGFEVVEEWKFAKEIELESQTVSMTSNELENTDKDFTGFKEIQGEQEATQTFGYEIQKADSECQTLPC